MSDTINETTDHRTISLQTLGVVQQMKERIETFEARIMAALGMSSAEPAPPVEAAAPEPANDPAPEPAPEPPAAA